MKKRPTRGFSPLTETVERRNPDSTWGQGAFSPLQNGRHTSRTNSLMWTVSNNTPFAADRTLVCDSDGAMWYRT